MKPGEAQILRRLISRYGRNATLGEVLAKVAEPKRRGRPKKYYRDLMAHYAWLAVEIERDKGPAGRRLTIEKACQNLIKKERERFGEIRRVPGWQMLRKHRDRAEAIARGDGAYRKMLHEDLAEWREICEEENVIARYLLGSKQSSVTRLFENTSPAEFEQIVSEFMDEVARELEELREHKFWNEEIERELVSAWCRGLRPGTQAEESAGRR